MLSLPSGPPLVPLAQALRGVPSTATGSVMSNAMSRCAVLCCAVLCCAVLRCAALSCARRHGRGSRHRRQQSHRNGMCAVCGFLPPLAPLHASPPPAVPAAQHAGHQQPQPADGSGAGHRTRHLPPSRRPPAVRRRGAPQPSSGGSCDAARRGCCQSAWAALQCRLQHVHQLLRCSARAAQPPAPAPIHTLLPLPSQERGEGCQCGQCTAGGSTRDRRRRGQGRGG